MSSINQSSIMQEYGDETNHTHQNQNQHQLPPKERDQTSSSVSILQGLNTIIQLHFEKTLEKKRAVDAQKKYLWKLFHLFFILLSLILFTLSQSHSKLLCRHCWIPITFLTLSHLIFYISVAHTLRCINGFKYQRRCHKLTLCLATEKLRQLKARLVMKQNRQGLEIDMNDDEDVVGEFEIPYQEPDETYFAKFKRNWAMHFGFILFIYAFMVSASAVLLCS